MNEQISFYHLSLLNNLMNNVFLLIILIWITYNRNTPLTIESIIAYRWIIVYINFTLLKKIKNVI